MVQFSCLLRKSLILLLRFYRYFISPLLGCSCRFYPSCSEYACVAIEQHGNCLGLIMVIKRLLRCHPWHSGGYDPVPNPSSKSPTIMS